MMRNLAKLIVLSFFTCVALQGALYDPFLLGIHCDPHEPYCFLGAGSLEPIFYFSSMKHESALNEVIKTARGRHKKVFINTKALARKSIRKKMVHCYIWSPSPFYRDCCADAKAIAVSDVDIEYDWEDVDRSNIKNSKFLPNWVTFNLSGKAESFWLSSAQKRRLDELLAQSGDLFSVNLSAFGLFSIYRDLIPAEQVIKPCSSINNY